MFYFGFASISWHIMISGRSLILGQTNNDYEPLYLIPPPCLEQKERYCSYILKVMFLQFATRNVDPFLTYVLELIKFIRAVGQHTIRKISPKD